MTLVLCVDDRGGLLFGGKRQSRDRVLIQRLLEQAAGRTVVVTPYSAQLFPEGAVTVSPHPEVDTRPGQIYFAEDGPLPDGGVSRLVLYRWNRRYPGTRFFREEAWKLKKIRSFEFTGSSHQRITEDVYEVEA